MTPAPYLTMADLAKLYRVHLRTAQRWAAEDKWRRTTGKPVRWSLADAQQSYEQRRDHGSRVQRHLQQKYGLPGRLTTMTLQPWEDVDGTDRSGSDLLSLEDEATPRRNLMVQMLDALVRATMVGNPAPIVREMYERMSSPRPGDLVVEHSARSNAMRGYRGFGILLVHRTEWASKDDEWTAYLDAERAASPDGTVFDDERLKTEAWYVQYGPGHRDICRWENATFFAVPVEQP